jgi:hypothetical protein
MGEQVATLVLEQPGPDAEAARERLADVLGSAVTVDAPDPETGVFDVTLDAASRDDALKAVWNAIAAAGADDHILFLEHPDIPGHWRSKSV